MKMNLKNLARLNKSKIMEEKILEILDKNTNNWRIFRGDHFDAAAEEITTHITEFIEWKDFGSHPFVPWYDEIAGKMEYYYVDDFLDEHFSLNDLYKYWKDNIKN